MTIFAERPTLLEPYRRGQRDALEAVYRHYVNDVARVLRYGFRNASGRIPGMAASPDLLDTVQEAFTHVFSPAARAGYDASRLFRPYLLRVVRNVRIDALRRSGREVFLTTLDDADDQELEMSLLEAQRADHREADERLQREVRAYVETLTSDERHFVQMRFCDELAQVEVAARLNVTRRKVRTMETKVLSGLRSWLDDRLEGEAR